ncbi:hypothetical protein [Hoeflea alexandrii]|uniref:hypothetical protein n=1 Tax=Hoeflea alexandrii TaxID=288436 RepID=UPI0022AF438B|nr:hypothetical protein [Hoeflea alexandrii]MCZ4288769.1 hypothetical protein [Hoeflea alexandrii]
MSDNPASIEETITLLKIQALLAGAYELSRQADKVALRSDTKFLSYLIKMARMEVGACFETVKTERRSSENRDNLDRM